MSATGRQYDVVLFGATGYTGKLTASYMATAMPTNVRWAIAGRSTSKLEAIAATCKNLSSDRIQPGKIVFNSVIFTRHLTFLYLALFLVDRVSDI
jgi:hypothetical protein